MNRSESHYLSGNEPPTDTFSVIVSQLLLADFQIGASIADLFNATYATQPILEVSDDDFLSLTSDALHLTLLCQHNTAVLHRDLINSLGGFPLPQDADFKQRAQQLLDTDYEALLHTASPLDVSHLIRQLPAERATIKNTLKNWHRLPDLASMKLSDKLNNSFNPV